VNSHVVIELVVGVPAEHDVAEAEPAVERRFELGPRHVLAAQDPVDVEDADLDVLEIALRHDGARIAGILDGARGDCAASPPV
jgi:hypothetical protein